MNSKQTLFLRALIIALILLGGYQITNSVYMIAKANLAQRLLESAWKEAQTHHRQAPQTSPSVVRPWPWADSWPIAKLSWPDHDQSLIVLSGGSGRNLAFAPAHLSATPLPGAPGISVIGGHRDTHFQFLQHVAVGDQFHIESQQGQLRHFTVSNIFIADAHQNEVNYLSDTAQIALITCYPFNDWQPGGSLRYVVIGQSTPPFYPLASKL